MNKKQLIVVCVLSLSILISNAILSIAKEFSPFPKNTGFLYQYDTDNVPKVCFFPIDKARWDGYKITNKNWSELTDFQKTMFIGEWVEETKKNENVTIDMQGGWPILIAMNKAVEAMEETMPNEELPMIKILRDNLEKANLIKAR